ncbi:hypothetical protein [Kitasatospora phosalacinea]|uniref:DUF2029 domain-containing protein n=1 Tax=Kitasatospora phosalacinea TaxID=2065 RepID=A0ABW6GFV4_9ACTN
MTRFRRRLVDLAIFVSVLALLAMLAGILQIDAGKVSLAPHYVWQVEAWLDGRFDLGPSPGPQVVFDKITVNGHYYLMYPPLPAMVMLPFVWLLGDGFSDVWFTWGVAALDVVLMFRTLELMRHRRITRRTTLENLVLAVVFGFGTIVLWLSLGGAVWFTGQLMSTAGIVLVLHSTICRCWWLAWLGVGLIALTRTTEVVVGVVPALVYLRDLGVGRRAAGRWNFRPVRLPSLREVAATVVPLAVCGGILLARNKLYFGSVTSTGYDIHSANDVVVFPYGLMSWHYVWPNFVIDFLRFPDFHFTGVNDAHPVMSLRAGGMGTSIFFSTPLMLLFLVSSQGRAVDRWMRTVMWTGTVALFVPVILFQAAGYDQVGARYLLPVYPTLFLLLAMRADRIGPRWVVLAGLGVFSNILLAKAFWAGRPSSQFAWTSAAIVLAVGALTCWLLARENRARPGTGAGAPGPDDGTAAHRDDLPVLAEAAQAR